MAITEKFVSAPNLYLAGSGVVIGATSIVLTDFKDIDGNILAMSDFGTLGYITLEPNTSNAEQATFSGVVANANGTYTLTGIKNSTSRYPYTQSSGLKKQHSGGTTLIISDTAAFWATPADLGNDATITGIYTFATGATPIITDAPTTATQAANKGYVDGVAIAGGANASSTVKGISKLSLDPVAPTNPIAVGDNDTRVPPVNTSTMTANQVAALAGTGTPNGTTGKYVTNDDTTGTGSIQRTSLLPVLSASFQRGETINGGTTPVPVMIMNDLSQSSSDITGQLSFGAVASNPGKIGIKFIPQGTITSTTLQVYLSKSGTPSDNVVITIQTDSAGAPSGTPISNGTANNIAGTGLTGSAVLTTATFASPFTLAANTTYWIVASRSGSLSNTDNYNMWGDTTSKAYANFAQYIYNGTSWVNNASNYIPYFSITPATGTSYSVWRADANALPASVMRRYDGFVTDNGAIGTSTSVKFGGILSGFVGLTQGSTYYVSDTVGTIQTSAGTATLKVGVAISPTQLLMVYAI